MKKSAFLFTVLLIPVVLTAQNKKENIPLEGKTEMTKYVNLGDKGFLVETSKGMYRSDYKLRYYSPSMEKYWEIPKPKLEHKVLIYSDVLASADGNTICHIGYPGTLLDKYRFVSVINKTGEVRSQKVTGYDNSHKSEIEFCNNNYLFLLFENNDDEPQNLVLNRISFDDFSVKTIKPGLPKIDSTGFSSFWTYKERPNVLSFWEYNSHTDDEIFLTRKAVNVENGKNTYYIVSLDSKGEEIKKNIVINARLEHGFLRPSVDYSRINNTLLGYKHDFRTILLGANNSVTRMEAEAFGGVKIDAVNKMIYVYGLSGPEEHKPIASEYTGFYIYAYDFTGTALFKIEKEISQDMTGYKYFQIHASPKGRGTCLETDKDQNLIFEITTGTPGYINSEFSNHTWKFDKKGSLVDFYSYFFDHAAQFNSSICFPSSSQSEAKSYILKNIEEGSKKNIYYYQKTPEGEIVIENDDKNNSINLLYYK